MDIRRPSSHNICTIASCEKAGKISKYIKQLELHLKLIYSIHPLPPVSALLSPSSAFFFPEAAKYKKAIILGMMEQRAIHPAKYTQASTP